jgi:SAM-dependent methyltransferase
MGDVARDKPPQGPFDLIHARLVLTHVPEREHALVTMASALAPGGVLVIEDADVGLQPNASLDATPEAELANKIRSSFRLLLTRRDAEPSFGRTLPRHLSAIGLREIGADAWFPLVDARSERIEQLTVTLLRNQLEDAGLLLAEEIDLHLANLEAGRVTIVQPPLVGCWGWRR